MKICKYIEIAKISLSNSLVYRANIISRFCFYTIFIFVFMNLWKAIYNEGGVNGYSYVQVLWYLILTEYISFTCTSNIYNTMNDEVKTGAIAYQISRPMHYVLFQFANSLGQLLVNAFFFGILAIALGFVFAGPLTGFCWIGIPVMVLSIILSIILNYYFMMLIGLSAFIVEENFAMFLIYQKLGFMLGMFLPVEFLPAWLQPIAKSLPFSYIYWAPAKLFVDFSYEIAFDLILRQVIWVGLVIFLVMLFYRRCERRLQVNGG